jgi:hypothetical protein
VIRFRASWRNSVHCVPSQPPGKACQSHTCFSLYTE